jgi:aspartate carbamoyltransferase catalytic subunit
MHVLSAHQFDIEEMTSIFNQADHYRKLLLTAEGRRTLAQTHLGEQICSTFYEASTRTKASFEIAAMKLGMGVFETENAGEFSSVSKGETIEDSVRILSGYGVSAIVIRSKEEGVAARAAAASPIPILNAGDGKGEHPTQSLLDAYTIKREFGRLNNLKIVMGGDLKHGRTVRSLSQVLAKYKGNHITYVSIPELQISDDIKAILKKSHTTFTETADMHAALANADVVYWTRLQRERLTKVEQKSLPKDGFILDKNALKSMSKHAIIMHPLPRVDEIAVEVDDDPRARYFEQAENGLHVRMALLDRAVMSASA